MYEIRCHSFAECGHSAEAKAEPGCENQVVEYRQINARMKAVEPFDRALFACI
jgi:hypothetical protein